MDKEQSRNDLVAELRMRRWARGNYVPAIERSPNWHPIVLDEMERRDQELGHATQMTSLGYVPLEAEPNHMSIHQPHQDLAGSHLNLRAHRPAEALHESALMNENFLG